MAGAFTCKYCYTAVFILRAFSLHTRMLCHRDAFDHACFNAEIFLHGDTFAQRECLLTHTHKYCYRETRRDDCTLSNFTHRSQNKQRCFLQRNVCARRVFSCGHFHTDILLNDFLLRTRVWPKECSKHMQNHSFTTALGRDAFRGKWLAQHKPTLQFDLNV